MKKALITGINGQDGAYLTEFLLDKGYEVHGIIRKASTFNTERINHLYENPEIGYKTLHLHFGDLTDSSNLSRLLYKIQPDEVYNLGAQSVAEECLLPIKTPNEIKYQTFKEIWDEQIKKHKNVAIEKFNDTEVEVINFNENSRIKALGYWNGMGMWFKIKQISRHQWKDKVVKLSQKFGSVTVTPNHSILDANQKICMPIENPFLLNVRKLNYNQRKYIESLKLCLPSRHNHDEDFIWLKNENQKIKSKLNSEEMFAFCRFMSAFIAEGHTSFNKANNGYIVGISNQDKGWLEDIRKDLAIFYTGTCCYVRHKKGDYDDVWELQINSKILYELMRFLCGTYSHNKKLPDWYCSLKPEYLQVILDKLIEGDGCYDEHNNIRYTTASYKLACQLSLLFTLLKYDYTINEEVKNSKSYYHFRQSNYYYCTTLKENDKKIEFIDYDGWVYDITVDKVHNFAVGVGNIVVHNSHVRVSFDLPEYTGNVDAIGATRLLDAIKDTNINTKFYQASSSEIFGGIPGTEPQNENTPFTPRSPYGVAKLYAYWITRNYRESYGLFASNGILYNHESELRLPTFVTRKITHAVSRIYIGKQGKLTLGNLDAKRDWGHSKDFVVAMYLMLQHDKPDDFVISTGKTHTVREFVELAFQYVGIKIEWDGTGVNEKGFDSKTGKLLVDVEKRFFRPCEVDILLGDSSKAQKILGWKPKTKFNQLVDMMMEYDLKLLGVENLNGKR